MNGPTMTKGERTRQSILQAAYDLFLGQGYAATSMRQIADRSELALGGIYNHFDSKDAIFSELIIERHPFQQILPILLRTPAEDVESFVRNAAQALLGELGKRPDFIKLMFIEIVEFDGRNMPKILEHVLPQVLPMIEKFSENKKVLRPVPSFTFFRAFLGLFFSYYLTELLLSNTPAALVQGDALDYFVDIFLHGVMTDRESA
jgi:AcrR family transcriptional regulator